MWCADLHLFDSELISTFFCLVLGGLRGSERQPPCSLGLLAVRGFWLGLTDKSHQQRKDEEKEGRDCFFLLAMVDGGCILQPMSGSHVGLQGFISHFCCLLGLENNSVVIRCVASKGTFTIPSWFPSVLPFFFSEFLSWSALNYLGSIWRGSCWANMHRCLGWW